MPLLAREPSIFPESLLDRVPELTDASQRWWVLHTFRSRREELIGLKRESCGGPG